MPRFMNKDRLLNFMQRYETTSSKDTQAEVNKFNEGKEKGKETEVKHNDENLKKLFFPPEDDGNDSRWTLKYRELAPGLVELMPNTGVYVKADKLAECKNLTDSITLARTLLLEIFTASALSTCSCPGATADASDVGQARPRLDKHAISTLLKFVTANGQEVIWKIVNIQRIVNSMHQVILEMRRSPQISESELSKLVSGLSVAQAEADDECLKKKEPYTHKLVLPPEYDENDSRWTLKYREPGPGLVELMEYSGVYVNADQLAECKKLTYDCKTLVRMLLTEIFTTSALSTCSWAGGTTNASDVDGGQARPGLDEQGTSALLKFVVEYGQIKNWELADFPCILNSLRQIMLEMRRHRRARNQNYRKASARHLFLSFIDAIDIRIDACTGPVVVYTLD